MNLFSLKRKGFFTSEENTSVVEAIRDAERMTSGEIRVFVESRCKFVEPLERAAEVFWSLKMDQTHHRNSVLIYVAMRDHQFAVFADKGIHKQLGDEFWQKEVNLMSRHFKENHYIDALLMVIKDVGAALSYHFPFDPGTDKNELPDDIIFGK